MDHPLQTIDLNLGRGWCGNLDREESTEAVEAKPNYEGKWKKLLLFKLPIAIVKKLSRNGRKKPCVRYKMQALYLVVYSYI